MSPERKRQAKVFAFVSISVALFVFDWRLALQFGGAWFVGYLIGRYLP